MGSIPVCPWNGRCFAGFRGAPFSPVARDRRNYLAALDVYDLEADVYAAKLNTPNVIRMARPCWLFCRRKRLNGSFPRGLSAFTSNTVTSPDVPV